MAFSGPSSKGLGGARAGAGRPAGVPNKVNGQVREAVAMLISNNLPNLEIWMAEIHERDGPLAAMKIIIEVLEYAIPKLSRTELTHQIDKNSTGVEFKVTAPTQPTTFEPMDDDGA
jgi:hypothetical protein